MKIENLNKLIYRKFNIINSKLKDNIKQIDENIFYIENIKEKQLNEKNHILNTYTVQFHNYEKNLNFTSLKTNWSTIYAEYDLNNYENFVFVPLNRNCDIFYSKNVEDIGVFSIKKNGYNGNKINEKYEKITFEYINYNELKNEILFSDNYLLIKNNFVTNNNIENYIELFNIENIKNTFDKYVYDS